MAEWSCSKKRKEGKGGGEEGEKEGKEGGKKETAALGTCCLPTTLFLGATPGGSRFYHFN